MNRRELICTEHKMPANTLCLADVPVRTVVVDAGGDVRRVPCDRIEDGTAGGSHPRRRARRAGGQRVVEPPRD